MTYLNHARLIPDQLFKHEFDERRTEQGQAVVEFLTALEIK